MVFITGAGIGPQTLLWILDHHSSYVDQAVIISGLNKPIKGISWLIKPMVFMSMPLIKLRWFAKVQSKELSLPEAMFEAYYQGSLLISSATLTSILKENMSFEFSGKVEKLYPETLVIVGKYEKKIMKTSANRTAQVLGNHLYYEFNHGAHGIPYHMKCLMNSMN